MKFHNLVVIYHKNLKKYILTVTTRKRVKFKITNSDKAQLNEIILS